MRVGGLSFVLFFGLAATAQPAPAPPAPPASRTIVGEIVSIDLQSRTVVIRESVKATAPEANRKAKRETVTVALSPATSLLRGKMPVALEELRPSDHVVARYVVSPTGATALSFRVADRVVRVPATPGSSAADSVRPPAAAEGSSAH